MWSWAVGRAVRLVVVVGVLAVGLGFVGSAGAAAQTVGDVEVRDRLIADQEALLNVYRCRFNIDTQIVPGGCSNGSPVLPPQAPSQFSGTANAQDIAVRDQLVADQEALLNAYRCRFSIDTQIVPGGCQTEEATPEPTPDPTAIPERELPDAAYWSEFVRIYNLKVACGWYDGTYLQCHDHPEGTHEIERLWGELHGCEWVTRVGCRGYSIEQMQQHKDRLACREGWLLEALRARPPEAYCYHPDHPDVYR